MRVRNQGNWWWYALVGALVLAVGVRQLGVASVPGSGQGTEKSSATLVADDGVTGGASSPPVAGEGARADGQSSKDAAARGPQRRLVVHVAGAVRRPGVYRLVAPSRVDDAVRRAGGATASADLSAVNLAAEVEDGRQVIVPVRNVGVANPGAQPGIAGGGVKPPVNLNTATVEQLDGLDGVGPGIAAKIIAYRQEHSGFRSVEELGEVPGIGDKRLAALTPLVTV